MSVGEGRKDEPTGGQWVGVGADDAAGEWAGCRDAVVAMDDGLPGVDEHLADVAEASTGCGADC